MRKLLLALLLFPALASAGLVYDDYDPLVLNEYAQQAIREGDLGDARIMLERAALLAPGNALIQRNLRELRGRMAESLALAPAARSEAGRDRAPLQRRTPERRPRSPQNLPEPPAIWR